MDGLDINIISHILSFIDKSDIRNSWIVCKRFAEAIKRPYFWMQMAKRYFPRSDLFHHIDPFFLKEEPLKSQMRWIFDEKRIYVEIGKHDTCIYIEHDNLKWCMFCILHDFNSLSCIDVYTSMSRVPVNCIINSFSTFDKKWTIFIIEKGKIVRASGYVNDNEAHWNGEAFQKKQIVYPHGKGIWIFDDGRISKDAINGEPAFKRIKKFQIY